MAKGWTLGWNPSTSFLPLATSGREMGLTPLGLSPLICKMGVVNLPHRVSSLNEVAMHVKHCVMHGR